MHEAIFEVGPGAHQYVGEYAIPEPVYGDVGGR
jgi:hypothetical protein